MFASHICPACEKPGLIDVDDERWCFSCTYKEPISEEPLGPTVLPTHSFA